MPTLQPANLHTTPPAYEHTRVRTHTGPHTCTHAAYTLYAPVPAQDAPCSTCAFMHATSYACTFMRTHTQYGTLVHAFVFAAKTRLEQLRSQLQSRRTLIDSKVRQGCVCSVHCCDVAPVGEGRCTGICIRHAVPPWLSCEQPSHPTCARTRARTHRCNVLCVCSLYT